MPKDIVATERQRINWESEYSQALEEWGQNRLKRLLKIWQSYRGEKRAEELEMKLSTFSDRLGKLESHESSTVKQALKKIGQIPTLTKAQFEELGQAVLTAWENGRLRELIHSISTESEFSEDKLIQILMEAQVLTSLNLAEVIRTKILAVASLKERIDKRELENKVRDYIAKNPWLIAPQWETYKKEISLQKILAKFADEVWVRPEEKAQRIDLALESGSHLVVLEFMRPGLKVDDDHLNRYAKYVRKVRTHVRTNTGGEFNRVTGYLVADKLDKDPVVVDQIQGLEREEMYAMDWETLFRKAVKDWQQYLEILIARNPDDERLKDLLDYAKDAREEE